MLNFGQPIPSRYIRTSWMFSAQRILKYSGFSKICFFSNDEANELAETLRKRNVFARHSRENNFYVQRAKGLSNQTIIEVFLQGDPKSICDEAERIADVLERVTILSSTIALRKEGLLRKLGIGLKNRTEINLILSSDYRFLQSHTHPAPNVQGIVIDDNFCKRFTRCGFATLADYVFSNFELSNRVARSVQWLFDSRIEPRLPASIVKTSIALESLLIFSESESLAQALSERAAFILSSDPSRRKNISRILKRFYEVRSGVVHGNQKKAKKLTPSLLETVDRLTILLCLVIASNSKLWQKTEDLQEWCETQRWGEPSSEVNIPFSDVYLRNALITGSKEFERKI